MLADPAGSPGISYGLAEFIAAEEMGRMRGYWWAPDGAQPPGRPGGREPGPAVVHRRPGQPGRGRRPTVAYPAAGTPNADVSLLLVGLDGRRVEVDTGRAAFPYLVTVSWQAAGGPMIVVQSRDQRVLRLLAADPATGRPRVLREDTDPRWVDIVPGVPARTGDGRIAWAADSGGARRLLVGTPDELADGAGAAVTPPGLQVREVLSVDGDAVLFTASAEDRPPSACWLYRPGTLAAPGPGSAGLRRPGSRASRRLEEISPPGGCTGTRAGGDHGAGQPDAGTSRSRPSWPRRSPPAAAARPPGRQAARIAALAETAQRARSRTGPVRGRDPGDPQRAAAPVLA